MNRSLLLAFVLASCVETPPRHPLSPEQRSRIDRESDEAIAAMTALLAADPRQVEAYSRRGDAHFFRGRFAEAVADYEKMVELEPRLDAEHWRRGIALFYAGEYARAARQFEIYHTHDNVDRENGIWRFFSQVKAHGLAKAREGLLKYEKDDREPFPAVYRLFSGDLTSEQVLAQIRSAPIGPEDREMRLFYAHLYAGLNAAIREDRPAAVRHLREAVANSWAPAAGYGPRYMWHVGRVHFDRLSFP